VTNVSSILSTVTRADAYSLTMGAFTLVSTKTIAHIPVYTFSSVSGDPVVEE
jgi:hypothetical protein